MREKSIKKGLAVLLAVSLIFGVTGCVKIILPGESGTPEETGTAPTEPGKTESAPTEPEKTEPEVTATEPESSEEATLPEMAEPALEAGLFKGTYKNETYHLEGSSYLNLQSDGRFYRETYWSDGGGGSSAMGNYVARDGRVLCTLWFTQAGDPAVEAQPELTENFEIVDENTLKLISEEAEATYERVTDMAEVEQFCSANGIVGKLAKAELKNECDTQPQPLPSANPAKATALYQYENSDGFLKSATLCLFENGRYDLITFYSDGPTGYNMIGNYIQVGDELWLTAWFTGSDFSLTLCNGPADFYRIGANGNLITSAFQGSTGGLDIVLKKLPDSELKQAAVTYDVAPALKYYHLYGN